MRPYSRKTLELARELRKQSTPAEKILWERLRNRGLAGLRFRRQQPIGSSVVDFYCSELRLVVELEGSAHDEPEQRLHDDARFAELSSKGFRILRVRNDLIHTSLDEVLQRILEFKSAVVSAKSAHL